MKSSERIREEIELIRSRSDDGAINPAEVVRFAANPKTALHKQFTWDDTKAAAEYRLWQARKIISVCVYYEPAVEQKIRAYLSLPEDRGPGAAGYRKTTDIARNVDHRAAMLAMALRELEFFQQKYAVLSELANVFEAARVVRNRVKAKIPRRNKISAKAVARRTAK
jgi:hypothetical protein